MRLRLSIICIITVLVLANACTAQDEVLTVEKMIFCTAVEERAPVGEGTEFPDTIDVVMCYTRITGSSETTIISHVWYFEDEEMARVNLPVRSENWRTWSSKRIVKGWSGKWRVDAVSEEGMVLESAEFFVRPTG